MKSKLNQMMAVGIMITGLCLNAFAGPDLGDVMQLMKTNLTKIQQQVSDPTQNVSTEAYCIALSATIDVAKTVTPDKVLAMPADQQAAQTQTYVQMLTQLQGLVAQVKGDLENNDNASAAAVINQILTLKSQGHALFR